MVYVREAAGGEVIEDVWNQFNHGEQTLFLAVDTTFSAPLSKVDLLETCRNAWIALRFDLPIIAAHTDHDESGNTLITYRLVEEYAHAYSWATTTLLLYESDETLDETRYRVGQIPLPNSRGEQTFLYVIPRREASVSFLLHTSHVPFDGAGIKVIFSRFLRFLSKDMDGSIASHNKLLPWGTEGANLTPVALEVLVPDEAREGEEYRRTLERVLSICNACKLFG